MHDEFEFEWDAVKDLANQRKHQVGFETAIKVFDEPFLYEPLDDARDELRFNAIGIAYGLLLHVTYTLRGNVRRIISARRATPHEKRKYHEIQT